MQIIPGQSVDIAKVAAALQKGKTIVYPTETCYGLGCDATNAKAVDKIFAIKKRQKKKTVLVVVSEVAMIMEYIDWGPALERIAQTYWPGPVTAVAQVRPGVSLPEGIVRADNTIAFRVTNHPLAQQLCEALGKPLVSTSANVAAEESPYDSDSVLAMFQDATAQPDLCIDGGALPHQAPSTIVKIMNNDHIEILRQGEVVVPVCQE